MDRIVCSECRQCNHKGKPSVLRMSKYCNDHYIGTPVTKDALSFLTSLKDRFFNKRYSEETKDVNKKGFRKIWFLR